ncbi:helix-turn-helix domain-containing protein [Streptomyces sp. Ag109_O5-1]|uniref:helix-turn-helix domain-containing protein n=1 Tax=Streptomyces sp. Ag109_O5-1 TaxID=1938851 RepID=UPI000F4E4E91|nr:helix-turn-helix domain-containing protein [Streptomyces sp. Ag109_O5-1]
MLEPVGLDDPTERTYRHLLASPPVTATELARHQSCSTAQARRMLDELVAVGLAVPSAGRPTRYAPLDPRIGLAALIRARRLELERAEAALDAYGAEFNERKLSSDPSRLVEIIEGPTAITDWLTELMAGAEHEVLCFDAPPYLTADASALRAEEDLLARGVRARAVYSSQVLAIPERAELLQRFVLLGEEARVLPHVPLKLLVFDRRDAIIPLTAGADDLRSTAALVHRSPLCDALVDLFEASWQQATPVFGSTARPADDHPDLGEDDRALLHLLHAGLKDETIARQLGLSERTLRRRIAGLTTRLEATSRFQAGAQAVRRGWI